MILRSKRVLSAVCLATVVLCAGSRLITMGWLFPFAIGSMIGMLAVHLGIQVPIIRGVRAPSPRSVKLLLLSNVLLLGAFLLQYDYGEAPGGWLAISGVCDVIAGARHPGTFVPGSHSLVGALAYNALLFVPVAVAWSLLLGEDRRSNQGWRYAKCPNCGYPLCDKQRCAECGTDPLDVT